MKQPSASSDEVGAGSTGEVRTGELEVLETPSDDLADIVPSNTFYVLILILISMAISLNVG